jgi:quercetin dioxygenase-like cupin family protein
MIVSDEQKVSSVVIDNPEVHNVAMKVLIGEKEGWADHVMRVFELGPDGHTPRHQHPWPHINYMVEGTGTLFMDGREHQVQAGGYAYVPAGVEHQFRNAGQGKFRFICIVPKEGHL